MTRDPDTTHPHGSGPTPAPIDAVPEGLTKAFDPDLTPGGWSQPPPLREDLSDDSPVVHPWSGEIPRDAGSPYQLLGEIASGGMGTILKGRDHNLGRDLAVKVLKAELATRPAAIQRFVEEAQVGGQLQHPGVVPVYDLGRLPDGRPYFAMKLVKGRTLADLLADRPDSDGDRGRFLRYFLQVCQTVAYAHSRGVIHRDLKPLNIMVGAFDEVLVVDWGLAKVLPRGGIVDERSAPPVRLDEGLTEVRTARFGSGSETEAGSVLGTPAFMPPEQAGGELDRLDERADVFGLGAILCVILTGQPPYVAGSGEALRLMAVRGQVAEAFARLDVCGADAELVALCRRCLTTDRDGRPRHAGEVAQALAEYLAGVEARVRRAELERASAAAEAREQRKRRRVQAALGMTLAALVVVGGSFAWWAREKQLARVAEGRERHATAEREVTRAVEVAAAAYGRAVGAVRDPARWAEAMAAAGNARDRAAALDAPADVRDRVERLASEVEQGEKNRRLIATLLDNQAGMGDELTAVGGQDFARADQRYERAFREYGADLFAMTIEAATELLSKLGGDVRVELAAALDDWAYVRASARLLAPGSGRRSLTDWYREIAEFFRVTRRLDPDPFRNQVRDAVAAGDRQALSKLLACLAEEIDPAAHPAQTVNLLAVFLPYTESWALEAAVRLLRRAQPHHPGDFQINHNLAFFHLQQRRFVDALPYAAAAIAVRPRSAAAWDDWARALAGVGRTAEAVAAHKRVYTLSPRSLTSRVWAIALLNRSGDREGAAASRAELDRLPADTKADLSLAYIRLAGDLKGDGDQVGIESALREAVLLAPTNAAVRVRLAALMQQRGDLAGAVAEYREAVRSAPKAVKAHNDLAWILAAGPDGIRDGQQAVGLATRACELTEWKDAAFIDTLSAAYAETGDFARAAVYQRKALAVPGAEGRYGAEFRERLKLYEGSRPYREPALAPRTIALPPEPSGR